jgi:hypothetical protein
MVTEAVLIFGIYDTESLINSTSPRSKFPLYLNEGPVVRGEIIKLIVSISSIIDASKGVMLKIKVWGESRNDPTPRDAPLFDDIVVKCRTIEVLRRVAYPSSSPCSGCR